MRRELIAVVAAAVLATPSAGLATTPSSVPQHASRVVITPDPGSLVAVAKGHYRGTIEVSGHDGGLAVVEDTDVDSYLLGISEVPFSWPMEALRTQAVAARTYLAWTLARGRSSTGAKYGYDICATSACQVYSGMDGVLGPGGSRWREAVDSTADELLVYGGRPAEALYSSTTGGRTRSVQDVFGTSPLPYLRAVASPGEQSPFVRWSFDLTGPEMASLLDAAGLVDGALVDVRTETTPDGSGPWLIDVDSTKGSQSVGTWKFRSLINGVGSRVLPLLLPAHRSGGKRYPQTIMSPTYTVEKAYQIPTAPSGWLESEPVYRVEGSGWGHLVGLSQYGAKAMADGGAAYGDILAHYYGGLRPQSDPGLLPATVRVGLVVGRDSAKVTPTGPVSVEVDGTVVARHVLGSWSFGIDGGRLVVSPPVGLGEPPSWIGPLVAWSEHGIEGVSAVLGSPAEVRIRATGPKGTFTQDWHVVDAGEIGVAWGDVIDRTGEGRVEVIFDARSPQGTASAGITILTGS